MASVRDSLLQGILFAAVAGPEATFIADALDLDSADDGSPANDAGDDTTEATGRTSAEPPHVPMASAHLANSSPNPWT